MKHSAIAGQLNTEERRIITDAILKASRKPKVVLEVGTWLGGGSTLHLLKALEANGHGHLWGIEADRLIYHQMVANIQAAVPEAAHRFTPLFGFSDAVIPRWLSDFGEGAVVDFVFLDGGDNPMEQVSEFRLVDPYIPVGGHLFAHDAKLRKGKWLRPYLSALDHWSSELHDVSEEGLYEARKIRPHPSAASAKEAETILRRLRRDPLERLGAFLPRPINAFLLGLLPKRLMRRFAQGRR